MHQPRWRNVVPQLAVVAPIVAFAIDGTAVPIEPWTEEALRVACFPILATVAWSLVSDTRFARTVAAVAMVIWWALVVAAIYAVSNPRTSAFGMLTVAAVPVVVAFTFGQAWGIHDVRGRDES